jgi:phage terminase large subunit-like protein
MMHVADSLTSLKNALPQLQPSQIGPLIAELDDDTAAALLCDWPLWARDEQLAPSGDWYVWLILAGRGWGKTRTGAEYIRQRVESGVGKRIALIGQTAADVRDVIVEGESGILATASKQCYPKYEPSKRRITWPNGAVATTYAGDSPDQLRGPQHDTVWCDELAKWRYAQECWDNMEMGLRLGTDPRAIVTTTPRPIPLIITLRDDSQTVRPTTNLSTHRNRANVSQRFVERVIKKYAGTRLGRQELDAEILDDTPGALWTRSGIEASRERRAPELVKITIGVDPSSGGVDGETGIIGAGKDAHEHGYALGDYTSSGDPAEWAPAVIKAYIELHADKIVAEKNQGGAMVEHVIRQTSVEIDGVTVRGSNLPIELVWASRGKHTRAEPVSILWSQTPARGHFVGALPELEDQCCTWVPGEDSPDRMDALVWAFTDLFPNEEPTPKGVLALGAARGAWGGGRGKR